MTAYKMEFETIKRIFGEHDWIEVRREAHHPYGMCTIAGVSKAWDCYKKMGLLKYEEAVEFVKSYPAPQ